ncbi:hypothetical protein [Bacillus cereus]|uniref:hypothetical protein n=1 Tax=Bacillus cereus TaxID=1396 RepID=UPI00027C00D6|nr:hypothetical protein [Bacillus cereus]EJV59047.1 hypothetical protein IEM_04230 [Bacillus cereus BAG6O-2]
MKYVHGFYVREDIQGETVLVSQESLSECIEYINKFNVESLQISDMYYELEEISFLEECKNIKYLSLNSSYLKDVSSIYKLENLRSLSVNDSNYTLELNRLTTLEELYMYCDKKVTGWQELVNLKSLYLWKYNPQNKDLKGLDRLRNLEILSITQSKITSLRGIKSLEKLKTVKLNYLRTLINIDDLKYTNNDLCYLEIEACKKIEDFNAIEYLTSLETLNLFNCGQIRTIKFIQMLNNLKQFSFGGSNVIDGDISFCEGIEYVSFTDKKHYSHKNRYFNNF